ncbi:hypothetical protein B296_00002415 [Ensete ventricosum]|uniref:Uncharacterized protein n=1 Tax=Ensete ventricosum TaxID=4639 RepID=A0A427B8I6_ENSVE|nr:hypothetical protein B296_00002415 [Ensete ventricosum]
MRKRTYVVASIDLATRPSFSSLEPPTVRESPARFPSLFTTAPIPSYKSVYSPHLVPPDLCTVGGSSMESAAVKRDQKEKAAKRARGKYLKIHVVCKASAALATLAAASLMGFNKQISNVAGFEIKATYNSSPAFKSVRLVSDAFHLGIGAHEPGTGDGRSIGGGGDWLRGEVRERRDWVDEGVPILRKVWHSEEWLTLYARDTMRTNERSFEAHVPYLRDAFDRVTKVIQLAEAKLGSEDLSTRQEDAEVYNGAPILAKVTKELDCFSAHIRLMEPDKSKDKAEYKIMDSRAMGLAAPWYRRGGTSVELSIPYSHRGRALVVKGAEEPNNLVFSTTKRMGEVEYPSSLTYPAEEFCISSFDYSTTVAKSGWEPKGRVVAKVED